MQIRAHVSVAPLAAWRGELRATRPTFWSLCDDTCFFGRVYIYCWCIRNVFFITFLHLDKCEKGDSCVEGRQVRPTSGCHVIATCVCGYVGFLVPSVLSVLVQFWPFCAIIGCPAFLWGKCRSDMRAVCVSDFVLRRCLSDHSHPLTKCRSVGGLYRSWGGEELRYVTADLLWLRVSPSIVRRWLSRRAAFSA